MRLLQGLTSVLRGSLWLVRAAGLRRQVEAIEQHLASVGRGGEAGVARAPQEEKVPAAWLQAGDLRACERRVYSQHGEDGILAEILRRVGVCSRFFVEFGVETGVECNCARLVLQEGWQGLFIEGDGVCFEQLRERYRPHPGVRCVCEYVTSANLETLLAANAVPAEFDVLSIDIDGNDYWVWASLENWRPRVVVIEYNASHPPPRRWVMQENPGHRWDGTNYFGASLASLAALGRQKGYTLVATTSAGVNAFFVRDDLVRPDRFLDPVVHYHYSPPTYGPVQGGHPPRSGPFVEI